MQIREPSLTDLEKFMKPEKGFWRRYLEIMHAHGPLVVVPVPTKKQLQCVKTWNVAQDQFFQGFRGNTGICCSYICVANNRYGWSEAQENLLATV
jgi:hypothetical protein